MLPVSCALTATNWYGMVWYGMGLNETEQLTTLIVKIIILVGLR